MNFEECDLLVFCHLRWKFVFQRPQHLMSRFAQNRRVYFFEEPCFEWQDEPTLKVVPCPQTGVRVVTPYLPEDLSTTSVELILIHLVNHLLEDEKIKTFNTWYYTPMALYFTRQLKPKFVIYDCMDELSLFKGAPPALLDNERELLSKADLVFTGGHSLFKAKQHLHSNIHPFPSSIDRKHFSLALDKVKEPEDQSKIPFPRFGFYGVIDERMDIELLREVSRLRPDWHFVMIGPVLKVEDERLPRGNNIHYLGQKDYQELPLYLSGWDVAILPFARNESTRYISPTKTPEYLAAGRPVISTSIQDVVSPYGNQKLVHIADTPKEFIREAELALKERDNKKWWAQVDQFISGISWDQTWKKMAKLEAKLNRKKEPEKLTVKLGHFINSQRMVQNHSRL